MLFNFNLYSSLLLPGFIQGIVMAMVLFWRGWQEDKLADRLLATFLVILSFHIAQYMLAFGGWYDSHDWHSSFMFYFPFHIFLWIGPTIYFYFRSLTNQEFKLKGRDWLHFLPGLIHALGFLLAFLYDVVWMSWIQDQAMPFHYNTKGILAEWIDYPFDNTLHTLGIYTTLAYICLTIYTYRQYRKYLNDHFSETKSIEFHWLRNVLYAVLGLFIFRVVAEIVSHYIPNLSYVDFWYTHFVFAIVIYFVSIQGYTATLKLPKLLQFNLPEAEPLPKEIANTPEWSGLKERLSQLMEKEKPYLQSEINLQDLAKKIKTNPSLLSKVINQGFGQNFNDYINSHRVKAVEEKLLNRESDQYTLMSIALECGFNSKATFNRAFRKFTGKSPREFLAAQNRA